MIAQAGVNLEVFSVVLKAVLDLQYYRKVFSVLRVTGLHMISPLQTFVLVNILTIVSVVKVIARVRQSPEILSPASSKRVRRQRSPKILSPERVSPMIQEINMSPNLEDSDGKGKLGNRFNSKKKERTPIVAVSMNDFLPSKNQSTLGDVSVMCKEGTNNKFMLEKYQCYIQ